MTMDLNLYIGGFSLAYAYIFCSYITKLATADEAKVIKTHHHSRAGNWSFYEVQRQ